jgi:hypothetical protein
MLHTRALVALVPLLAGGSQVPLYDVAIVPKPPGVSHVSVGALNSHGAIAGGFHNPQTFWFDGLVWTPDLQIKVMSETWGYVEAHAMRILDDGTIVGSGTFDGAEVSHGTVITPDGQATILPSLAGDVGVVSVAFDATLDGFVVGRSSLVPTPFWLAAPAAAVVWEDGVVTSLGSLGGFFAEAYRVNESRTIIGRSNTATSDLARGFVWDPVNGMREITPLQPGQLGHAHAINEAGVIAGAATSPTGTRACVWADPAVPPFVLGQLAVDASSSAYGIDGSGRVVGTAITPSGSRARLWRGGAVWDLNDLLMEPLPFPLGTAHDINANGQILASAEWTPAHGFVDVVLTPRPPLTGAPSEISLSSGGAQTLTLAAGPLQANRVYLVLGSLSGTQPGVPIGSLHLPLQLDAYTEITLTSPNTPPLSASLGLLDARGVAIAQFALPPGLAPSFAGLTIHHAFVTLTLPDLAPAFASNAVAVMLVP